MSSGRRPYTIHGLPLARGLGDLASQTAVSHRTLWSLIGGLRAYTTFELAKKSGGFRKIAKPTRVLKRIQRWILRNILSGLHVTLHCYGFEKGSRLRDHAEQHIGALAVLTLDVEDFFPSIGISRIVRIFRTAGYARSVAWMLARLCTWNGVLPQGGPCSSKLANLVCYRMDLRLSAFASARGFVYTRYADDLTFSCESMSLLAKARPFIAHIIADSGFVLNVDKARLIGPSGAKIITGLVLAPESVGVGRRRLRELRVRIHRAHVQGDANSLSSIQGWLDYVSDTDAPRYEMLVAYIGRLQSGMPSPLALLRLRPRGGGRGVADTAAPE